MKINYFIASFALAFLLFGMQQPKIKAIKNGEYVVKIRGTYTVSISDVEISQPITLAEYKTFLNTIDDSEKEQLMPNFRLINRGYDSNSPNNTISWEKYFNSGRFDAYPVLGVTWESAVHYCKWLNEKENTSETEYEYRLPIPKELVVYFQYVETKQILTHKYEWTTNSYNESFGFNDPEFSPLEEYQYDTDKDDVPAMRRKTIINTSTTKERVNFLYYNYEYQSNEQLSFRVVKAKKIKPRFSKKGQIEIKQ